MSLSPMTLRQPDMGIGLAEGEGKASGHDAYDDVRLSVELDYFAENVCVAAVGGSPYGIA